MSCSVHEIRARARKATLLANVLDQVGVRSTDVAELDATSRRLAEQAAGVRRASEDTWAAVQGVLEAGEQRRPAAAPNVEALV